MMSPKSHAQVTIQKKVSVECLKSLRMGFVSLYRCNNVYTLSINSDNQFDDSFMICLGTGKEAAQESLEALIEVASTIKTDDVIAFNDGQQDFRLHKGAYTGELYFKADFFAGWGKTSKGELTKLLNYLKKLE